MKTSSKLSLVAGLAIAVSAMAENTKPVPSKLIERFLANVETADAPLPPAAYSKLSDQIEAQIAKLSSDGGMYPAMCGHSKLMDHLNMLAMEK